MKTILGIERECTRLRVGDKVEISGRQWRVAMVNDCRALVVCLNARTQERVTRFGERFEIATVDRLSISPNSEVTIISRGRPE